MDRREGKAERLRRRFEIRYGIDKAEFTGYSGNISRTGVMLRAVRVFAPETVLNLEVIFPEKTWSLKGKVQWAREGGVQYLATGRIGMGIRFIDPPEEFLKIFAAPAASATPAKKAVR